jgi:hypothetical protein
MVVPPLVNADAMIRLRSTRCLLFDIMKRASLLVIISQRSGESERSKEFVNRFGDLRNDRLSGCRTVARDARNCFDELLGSIFETCA